MRQPEIVKQICVGHVQACHGRDVEDFPVQETRWSAWSYSLKALRHLPSSLSCGARCSAPQAHARQNAKTPLQEASSHHTHIATELCNLMVFMMAHRSLSMAIYMESLPEKVVPRHKRCLAKLRTVLETLVEVETLRHSDSTLQLFLDRVCWVWAAVPREWLLTLTQHDFKYVREGP